MKTSSKAFDGKSHNTRDEVCNITSTSILHFRTLAIIQNSKQNILPFWTFFCDEPKRMNLKHKEGVFMQSTPLKHYREKKEIKVVKNL